MSVASEPRTIPTRRRVVDSGGDWRDRAACVGRDPEMWALAGHLTEANIRAIRICGSCPVRAWCLAWALEIAPHEMIFAGETWKMGRRVRSRAVAQARHGVPREEA